MVGNDYVQYGCGFNAPIEWRNFDVSPTLRFERLPVIGRLYVKNTSRFPNNVEYGDIVKGLPIQENSCRSVYCSHVLEHLALDDFRVALMNTHSVLREEGIFRFVLPDLEFSILKYNQDKNSNASVQFLQETLLGRESRSKNLSGLLKQWLGNSEHLWMWDFKSISFELEKAGFVNVRRAVMGDSGDKMFDLVEDRERWNNALGVSCNKLLRIF